MVFGRRLSGLLLAALHVTIDGDDLDDTTRAQLVSVFRLTFRDPADVIEDVRGEPFYLLLAMNAEGTLRLKPQNLIAGLPIRQVEAVN